MNFEKVELITIDAGGTLLFPNPSVGAIYAEVLERHGGNGSPEDLEKAFLKVWRRNAAELVREIDAESERERWRRVVIETFKGIPGPLDLEAIFNDLWDEFASPSRWRLPPGARETIDTLRQRGYRLAILSNWDERLRGLLNEMDLSGCFETAFISCEIGAEKPDSRIFRAVEYHTGLRGEQILHIGDSHLHDVQGALDAGWVPVHFQGSLDNGAPHPGIHSFPELLNLLPSNATN